MKLPRKLLRDRMVQKLTARLGRELKPDRWLFIVGCYNSGTTLLTNLLATHPDIGTLPGEGVVFTDCLPRPERWGWNRLWARCQPHMQPVCGRLDAAAIAARIKRQWSFGMDERPILLEKSIANAARIPFLAEHFRPARFIYIVRDGYAAAEGIRRKARPRRWHCPEPGDAYPIGLCAEQWAVSDQVVERDLTRLAHVYRTSYEALTADPKTIMRQVTEFLACSPLPDRLFSREILVNGVQSEIRNMNADSYRRLTAADCEAVEAAASATLRKYGYQRPPPASLAQRPP